MYVSANDDKIYLFVSSIILIFRTSWCASIKLRFAVLINKFLVMDFMSNRFLSPSKVKLDLLLKKRLPVSACQYFRTEACFLFTVWTKLQHMVQYTTLIMGFNA